MGGLLEIRCAKWRGESRYRGMRSSARMDRFAGHGDGPGRSCASSTAYRDILYVGSRNLVDHRAATPSPRRVCAWRADFRLAVRSGGLCKSGDKRYDKLAKEFTKLLTSSYATTALFGGILLFLLIGFYPKLMAYLDRYFFPPSSPIAGSSSWKLPKCTSIVRLGRDVRGQWKEVPHFLRLLLNVFALHQRSCPTLATFQASPAVIAEGTDFERAWAATRNPTWWPVNIHRIIANVVLGGYICGAHAGIRYLPG